MADLSKARRFATAGGLGFFVFQHYPFKHMSVFENVRVCLESEARNERPRDRRERDQAGGYTNCWGWFSSTVRAALPCPALQADSGKVWPLPARWRSRPKVSLLGRTLWRPGRASQGVAGGGAQVHKESKSYRRVRDTCPGRRSWKCRRIAIMMSARSEQGHPVRGIRQAAPQLCGFLGFATVALPRRERDCRVGWASLLRTGARRICRRGGRLCAPH